MNRKQLLAKHPYAITHRNDGKWMTYLPNEGGKRIQRVRKTQKEIEDIVVEYWRKEEINPTVAEVFTEWNDYRLKRGQISESTHNRNKELFKRFYENSGFADRRVKSTSPGEWIEFLEGTVPEHHLKAKAFSNLRSMTRGFLRRAKRNELIKWNVDEMLQDVEVCRKDYDHSVKPDSEEVFNEDETPIVMNWLEEHIDNQVNACILLMFVTGIRVGEAVTLKHEDIHDGVIDIRRTETRVRNPGGGISYEVSDKPKTEAGIRAVVVPSEYEWLLKHLKRLNPTSEWVFVGELSHKRMTYNTVRRHMEYVCKGAGVPQRSLHKIRKTYSSILLDNGVDHKFVIDQMGHTNVNMDELYYHKTRRSVARKQAILDGIPEFRNSKSQ